MSDAQWILGEHERLETLLRDLRVVTQWEPRLLREEAVRAQLARDMAGLQQRLHEHFRVEESEAFLGDVERRDPAAAGRLKALQAQHGWILQKLATLELACEQDRGETHAQKLGEHLSRTLDALAEHEREETALVKQVFGEG